MPNLWREVTVEEARKTKRKADAEKRKKEREEQLAEWQQRRSDRTQKWMFWIMITLIAGVIWALRA